MLDAFVQRFTCCCVAEQVGQAELHGLSHAGGGRLPEASYPAMSSLSPPRQELGGHSVDGAQSDAECSGAGSTAGMSLEEKEFEKARLHQLVKDFAKEAIRGIAISVINPETARRSPHYFQMDRYLTVFSLKPKDGSTAALSPVRDFNVKDLTGIYKGVEVCLKAPRLGTAAPLCVGLDTNRADQQLFFCFDEQIERDKFYTCLKILRMSVDISGSGPSP